MKTRKKKTHFSTPHCDEVKSASGHQLKYNNKNFIITRNIDICVHRVILSGEGADEQPRFQKRSKNFFG